MGKQIAEKPVKL
jgi:hypothetical protein